MLTDVQVGSVLENPPINPITGEGRSQNDVNKEKLAYQRRVRQKADAIGEPTPVFQADFLFVKLPHKGVQLHRVAHGLFLVDATGDDISFTTIEYAHTPQPGVPGFWGTFVPAENPTFEVSKRKKHASKFIRHQNVTRENIVVYNVQALVATRAHQPLSCNACCITCILLECMGATYSC